MTPARQLALSAAAVSLMIAGVFYAPDFTGALLLVILVIVGAVLLDRLISE